MTVDADTERVLQGIDGARRAGWAKAYDLERDRDAWRASAASWQRHAEHLEGIIDRLQADRDRQLVWDFLQAFPTQFVSVAAAAWWLQGRGFAGPPPPDLNTTPELPEGSTPEGDTA